MGQWIDRSLPHAAQSEYESRQGSANAFEAWRFTNARTAAGALFGLLGRNGHTKEGLLELIRVSPRELTALKDCAARYPELAGRIERAAEYRERVEEEFERLCRQDSGHRTIAQADPVGALPLARTYFSMTPHAMRAPEFPAGSVL